jgi:tRNA pseudouridine38-40 synthase
MRRSAQCLVGIHDFSAFSAASADTGDRAREVYEVSVCRSGELVTVDLEANAFLRAMARIIVGTLVEVGQGRRQAEDVERVLHGRDRRLAGRTAPARGLVLMEVKY